MTEYRDGEKVWVPATVWRLRGDRYLVGVGNAARGVEVETKYIRPRADGAEPEPVGNVAKLREACHEAVTWLGIEVYPTKHSQEAAAILRAVLAEVPYTPIETSTLERLRGVCAWALDQLECPRLYTDQGRTDLQAALRAALAAAPAKNEGPQWPPREGHTVTVEGRAVKCEE